MLWFTKEKENTQNYVIEGNMRRMMTVDTYQKYQEKVEANANILCQIRKKDELNKGHAKMDVPTMEEVSHVSSYPLPESMCFYTNISDGVAKMRAAILLVDNVRLHQRNKNPLNYFHTNSKYGNSVAIRDSDTQETF